MSRIVLIRDPATGLLRQRVQAGRVVTGTTPGCCCQKTPGCFCPDGVTVLPAGCCDGSIDPTDPQCTLPCQGPCQCEDGRILMDDCCDPNSPVYGQTAPGQVCSCGPANGGCCSCNSPSIRCTCRNFNISVFCGGLLEVGICCQGGSRGINADVNINASATQFHPNGNASSTLACVSNCSRSLQTGSSGDLPTNGTWYQVNTGTCLPSTQVGANGTCRASAEWFPASGNLRVTANGTLPGFAQATVSQTITIQGCPIGSYNFGNLTQGSCSGGGVLHKLNGSCTVVVSGECVSCGPSRPNQLIDFSRLRGDVDAAQAAIARLDTGGCSSCGGGGNGGLLI